MPRFQQRHIIGAGLVIALIAWTVDMIIGVASGEGTLLQQLSAPSFHEISHFLIFVLSFAIFLIFACLILRSRDRLEEELQAALSEAAGERAKCESTLSAHLQAEAALASKAAALEAANRELEAFSYSVSHDLRMPLTVIYTAAQALRDSCHEDGGESGGYFIKTICDASQQMDELIEALQLLAQISRSQMCCTQVNLSDLAMEISAELCLIAPERAVTWEIVPGLVGYGDRRLLRIVIENLLGNAWKYAVGCHAALIRFGACDTPQGRAFFVQDNGAGFDMALAQDLFKPFIRLHDSQVFPGTGIGLATVQRVVERHGGRVWAESSEGGGATFYFTLPDGPGLA